MSLPERLRPYLRYAKMVGVVGTGCALVTYGVVATRRAMSRIVRPAVLEREKSIPQYIYIDDPVYTQHTEKSDTGGLIRLRSFKMPLMWRLLWLSRHGDREQRNMALHQLAAIRKSKVWEYHKLAQALDAETAVLLARTEGADLRYFLRPPMHIRRLARTSHYRVGRFRQILSDMKKNYPHKCTDYFLSKYFANVKEHASQAEESKPDTPDERKLCVLSLDAIHHQLVATEAEDTTCGATKHSLLATIAEVLERYSGDQELEWSALRVLAALSCKTELLQQFYVNGLLGYLARWLRSADVRLSCSSAVALANLAGEGQYRGGVYLLHPLYRSREPVHCDVLFLHGLRGGVFVTWRQRDPKKEYPLGIFGKTIQLQRAETNSEAAVRSDGRGGRGDGSAISNSAVKSGRKNDNSAILDSAITSGRKNDNSAILDSAVKSGGKNDSLAILDMPFKSGGKNDGRMEKGSRGLEETVLLSEEGACDQYSTYGTVSPESGYLADPDLRQVIEDLRSLEEEELLADLEVVVQDLPENSIRDDGRVPFTTQRKREALREELEDRCSYTSCWPKDWLPKDCPNLRVLGVDYWTSLSEWTSGCERFGSALEERAASLRSALLHAGVGRAPLVFVAHSMGGLIVEHALLDSAASDSYTERQLAEKTKALVFYSTPHRGSTLANMPRATAALVLPSPIVRQLQEGSPQLLRLQEDFVKMADRLNWETVSFGESKPTLVSAFKVPIHFVQAESADLGRGPFYKLPLDHLSICKPATRHSILYTSVVDILRRVVREEQDRKYTSALEDSPLWRLWRWSKEKSETEVSHQPYQPTTLSYPPTILWHLISTHLTTNSHLPSILFHPLPLKFHPTHYHHLPSFHHLPPSPT